MGMSASQVRLLQLTNRKSDIGYQLTKLSNERTALTRETQKISRAYTDALNSTILKWSNNGGVSYIDLSYDNLMKPGAMNQNKPYLLTDYDDKIIVDTQYQKYAELISPDGSSGGNWDSVRTQVLSELIGVDESKIDSMNTLSKDVIINKNEVDNLESKKPEKTKFKKHDKEDLLEKLGSSSFVSNSFSSGSNWLEAYKKDGKITLGSTTEAKTAIDSIIDGLVTKLSPYFMDDAEKLKKAGESQKTQLKASIGEGNELNTDSTTITGNSGKYEINVTRLIDDLLGAYGNQGGTTHSEQDREGKTQYIWYDVDTSAYDEWKAEYDEWEANFNLATKNYDDAVSVDNQLLTADEEKLIAFYDAMFSAIAEKGWRFNENINDTDYLNQMLQNNLYTITTVDRNAEYSTKTNEFTYDNDYSTDIASNFTNIYFVNDSNAREEALIEYEFQKSIINEKESKIDTRMKNLETEQAAINQMIQSIEQQKNDNIERNFSIMS